MSNGLFWRTRRHCVGTMIAFLLSGLGSQTHAQAAVRTALDPDSPDWALCRNAARDLTRTLGMPDQLLTAISLTETGITPPGRDARAPWPWTINVAGRGLRFASKAEAVLAARRLRDNGQLSVDVGCMQVNLKYHPRAFTSLEEAFDPLANMTYAAEFLTRLKDRHGDWLGAVRRYHSYRHVHNVVYGRKVEQAWASEKARLKRLKDRVLPVGLASVSPFAAIAAAVPMPVLAIETLVPKAPVAPRPKAAPIRLFLRTRLAGGAHLQTGTLAASDWRTLQRGPVPKR